MKTPYSRLILAFLIFTGLSAVAHAEPAIDTPATQTELTAVKKWRLSQLGDQAVINATNVTIVFAEGDQVSGSGGVNHYNGKYKLQADGQITIQDMSANEMGARDESFMKQEIQYFQLLSKAKRALLSNGNLVLECTDNDDKPIKLLYVAEKKD